MQNERWLPVAGFEGKYLVSDKGFVKSINGGGKILSTKCNTRDYVKVGLWNNGVVKVVPIHVLVLESFLCARPNGMLANHIDGNKLNNRLENLEWVSQSYNVKHAHAKGLIKKKRGWLTKDQVKYIRDNSHIPCVTMSKELGLSVSMISGIRTFKYYKEG